ncbi:MAG: hypothetical protein KZQ71_19995, partial [Candidatus Thiodiazotropha sp. (ex Lucinoma aequizonata)]|nr:hypothetical protein [Candidatus Thiodiazotropha sp. (ex Lucinoma aequizonata)]
LHLSLSVAIPAIQPRLRLSGTNRLRSAFHGAQRARPVKRSFMASSVHRRTKQTRNRFLQTTEGIGVWKALTTSLTGILMRIVIRSEPASGLKT